MGPEILGKVDSVVRLLEHTGELSAASIAKEVGEPVSSTYRLLSNLSAIGWVDPGSRRGLFRLGVYFMRIGARLEDRISVRDASMPSLRSLLADTGATSFLCLRRGTRAVCVERLEGRNVRSLALALGESLPLYRGAAPMALLAHLPASEREMLLDGFSIRGDGERPPPERGRLEHEVEETRRRGYAISDGDVTPGIAALGAPVFNHRGELEAAISISGLRSQIIDTDVPTARLLLDAALATSRALGYLGEPS